MSLPTASVPVAVLVLTWDETTPAVRALLEATEAGEPALDSVVVLVPAGSATEELTPEEFLPLEASQVLEVLLASIPANTELAPAALAAATTPLPDEPAGLVAPLAPAPAAGAALPVAVDTTVAAPAPLLPSALGKLLIAPGDMPPMPGLVGQETFAVPGGPAVRVLRLSEYSLAALAAYSQQALPAPTWVGIAALPTTPYLGSSASVIAGSLPLSDLPDFSSAIKESALVADAAFADAAHNLATDIADTPLATHTADLASPSYLPTEPSVAVDAEPDTTPTSLPKEPATIAEDAEKSTTELSEEAADELTDSFAVDVSPVQASWADALSSLQEPAAFEAKGPDATELAAATPTEPEPVAYAALTFAARQFDAPNLNFQIIQYARFAVPLALAAQPFGVIYAPAWPTWLAAQELRQRTGQPLVLHIATLAAADEPLDLAAGWPAEIQRQALHRADLILTETSALAYRLRQELDLPTHRVRHVPAADAAAIVQALRTVQVW